jgi:hypothetical protein
VLRQVLREDGGSVDLTGTLPMPLHFLQRDDVGVPNFAGDAREVVPLVLAETELNVVGDEAHATPESGKAVRRSMGVR